MAKITKNPMPKDDDFIHQYGGGVPQHGTKGSSSLSNENAMEFQKHMETQQIQNSAPPKVSPHDLVSQSPQPQDPHNLVQPMQKPAPENFGPPKITPSDADNQSNFGAPGSQNFKNVQSHFGPPDHVQEAQKHTQDQLEQAQNQTENIMNSSQNNPPQTLGAHNTSSEGASKGDDSGGKGKKKATYKTVEKMEIDNMLQNAMHHMKLKDPDPSAWK